MKISRNLHKVWAIILVMALCLCALPMVALATGVINPSESGVGSREFDWTLTNGGASNALTSNAKYNLTGDLTGVTEPFYIGTESTAATVILDLKGHSITSAKRAFIVCPGSSLTIKDSVGGGKVQGAEVADNEQGGVIRVDTGATFTLEGGSIVDVATTNHQSDGGAIAGLGATVNIAGGTVIGGTAYFGGSIYMDGGALTISGGTIQGGTATNENSIPYGGAVCVKNAAFTMTGGTITGGKAVSTAKTPGGGNLYLNASGKTFTISGGTIENGQVDNGNGGNIYVANGTLEISGDVLITGGTGYRDLSRNNGGGNIYMQMNTALNITGGTISNGTYANSYGGNIFSRGNITMTGGTITGGKAVNGGNIYISGFDAAKTFTISGGTIENGSIHDGTKKDGTTASAGTIDGSGLYNGENIYANSAVVAVSGGRFTDNDGGNAILAATKKTESPGTVSLTLAGASVTASDLHGKVCLVSGAVINADRGTTQIEADGSQIWINQSFADAAGMEAMNNSIRGTYTTGTGAETVYENVTAAELAAYRQALETNGFTLYSSNSFNGTSVDGTETALENLFLTYVSEKKVVTISYHSADGRTYVICEDKAVACLPSVTAPSYTKVCDPLITQVGSEDITLLDATADFLQENDMCYIIRLADGTFFIIDSAETATAERIYKILKKQAVDPNNIVISGWMISHPHVDHYRGFLAFAEKYASDTTITVKQFLYNFPANSTTEEASAAEQDKIINAMNTAYPSATHIHPHTGNVLRYADMAITFLYTAEDYLAANNGKICNVNGTSIVSRIVFEGGTSVFVPADHPTDGSSSGGTWCENKLEIWYGKGLQSDISTVFHHGFGGGAHKNIYYVIAPSVVLWDADWYRIDYHNVCSNSRNAYFCADNAPKDFVYVAGSNVTVLNLKNGAIVEEFDGLATVYTGETDPTDPTDPTEPSAPDTSLCPHCKKEVEWTDWTGGNLNDASLHGGHHHYRLTKASVTGSSQIRIGANDTCVMEVCIDLNGNNIKKTSRAFAIYGGTTLNLVNTSETESSVSGAYKAAAAGVINLDCGGGNSNLTIHDGVHLYSTAADDVFPYNAGVIQVNSGILTMYGGKITGRRALNGGAITVNGGTFNMYGGTITGGNAVMTSSKDSAPEGGNIYLQAGTMNLYGGIIENGNATTAGGNIYVATDAVLNITGGVVRNSASSDNIYVCGTVNLTLGDMANETAIALDGQILAESTATIHADVGTVETLENGKQIWYNKEATPEGVPGDFTGDGVVTNDDVVALLWHSLFPDLSPLEGNGDLNSDGNVTNDDVVKLLWYSLFPDENPL